ncbi:hypothetical protein LEMLEM_LOCUS11109 [Lemmus lemmus]
MIPSYQTEESRVLWETLTLVSKRHLITLSLVFWRPLQKSGHLTPASSTGGPLFILAQPCLPSFICSCAPTPRSAKEALPAVGCLHPALARGPPVLPKERHGTECGRDRRAGWIDSRGPAWLAPGMRRAGKMLGELRRRLGQVWGTGVEDCGSGVGAGVPGLAEGAGAGKGLVSRRTPGMLRGCRGAVFIPGLCPGSLLPEEPPVLSPAPPGPEATWLCLWARLVFRGARGSRSARGCTTLSPWKFEAAWLGQMSRCPSVPWHLCTPSFPPSQLLPPRFRPCIRHYVLPMAFGLARCS